MRKSQVFGECLGGFPILAESAIKKWFRGVRYVDSVCSHNGCVGW